MDTLYLEPILPERDPKGKLLKGSSLAKGNTWDKVYSSEVRQRQLERVIKMCKERKPKPTRTRKVKLSGSDLIFESAAQASRVLFGDSSQANHIIQVCRGKRNLVKTLRFEYYYDE